MNELRGVGKHERIDEELYHDYESSDARKVCVFVRERLRERGDHSQQCPALLLSAPCSSLGQW